MRFWVLAAALLASAAAAGHKDDLTALNALKKSIVNWAEVSKKPFFNGWDNTDPCGAFGVRSWSGVICSGFDDRVTTLMLTIIGPGTINGTLPPELDRLTAVKTIHFDGLGFTGQLPASWGANGGFASLSMLSLGQNKLSGPLPAEWGARDRFQKLNALVLHGNKFTGGFPKAWGNSGAFPNLKVIDVKHIEGLTGDLPPALSKLQQECKGKGGSSSFSSSTSSSTSGTDHHEDSDFDCSGDGSSSSSSSSSSPQDESSLSSSSDRTSSSSGRGFWSSVGSVFTTWWVWAVAIVLAVIAVATLARRRNVYVLLRGGSSEPGLPRLARSKDSKEAELS